MANSQIQKKERKCECGLTGRKPAAFSGGTLSTNMQVQEGGPIV
jgi:hypothetical protein